MPTAAADQNSGKNGKHPLKPTAAADLEINDGASSDLVDKIGANEDDEFVAAPNKKQKNHRKDEDYYPKMGKESNEDEDEDDEFIEQPKQRNR